MLDAVRSTMARDQRVPSSMALHGHDQVHSHRRLLHTQLRMRCRGPRQA